MIVCPVLVGGGKRFFPDGVRLDLTFCRVDSMGFFLSSSVTSSTFGPSPP
jgi:hypothetical protein